jgi:hypothetical protein
MIASAATSPDIRWRHGSLTQRRITSEKMGTISEFVVIMQGQDKEGRNYSHIVYRIHHMLEFEVKLWISSPDVVDQASAGSTSAGPSITEGISVSMM